MATNYSKSEALKILYEFFPDGKDKGDGFELLCPFHEDSNPSGSKYIYELGMFKCHVCDARGDIYNLIAAKLGKGRTSVKRLIERKFGGADSPVTVSQDLVQACHRNLLKSKKMLHLLSTKGIDQHTVEDYSIGIDGDRFTIPIYDRKGNVLNIRKYKPNAKVRKTINTKGFGEARLYPLSSLDEDGFILITEGEIKALLLCQLGFNGISATGGAGSWKDAWNEEFRNRDVVLIFDTDKAGRAASSKLARKLFPLAKSIRDLVLPLPPKEYPKGDITDYVIGMNADGKDLHKLITETDEWTPQSSYDDNISDDKVYDVHLSKTSESKWYGKFVQTEVVVSAKDSAPFIVPKNFQVSCTKDKDYCYLCPIFSMEENEPEVEIDIRRSVLLEMLSVHSDKLERILKKSAHIPSRCDVCTMKVKDTTNVEEVRLMPQLDINDADDEDSNIVRRAFYVGHGIETNQPYIIEARVVPEPNTQYATLIVYKIKESQDSLSAFHVTKELKNKLTIFQPKKWTRGGLEKHLEKLYADFEANVTRIYKRRNLHLMIDLVYHSVLQIPFQGKKIKGWVEGLILGDSGQGKSETTSLLKSHYGLGEKVETKGATVAGLLGGAQETSRKWFITWGVIPLNDRRLVILEEIKGMAPEVISKLTDMRSSGIAEIVKIETARTHARCRLIWVSNPRSDRQILSYNHGIEAVKELMGSLEDVRRFDIAIVVASGEVDKKWLNVSNKQRPKYEHIFTKELCKELLLWTWSRKDSDINISKDAEAAILKCADKAGEKYSSQIPLVEAADHRLKLARLSAALAARTFSTRTGTDIFVRKVHVEFIHDFMDELYSSAAMGYADYSRLLNADEKLHDEDEVKGTISRMPFAKDAVRSLLESNFVNVFDISDWTGMELDKCRELLGLLVRKNALKRGRRAYVKSPAFIGLLKRMQMNGTLSNETEYDKATKEEF